MQTEDPKNDSMSQQPDSRRGFLKSTSGIVAGAAGESEPAGRSPAPEALGRRVAEDLLGQGAAAMIDRGRGTSREG